MPGPKPDVGVVDESQEAVGGFVVSGCKSTAVLQPAETTLDHLAPRADGK